MATYSGTGGALVLGGIQDGNSIAVATSVASAIATINLTSAATTGGYGVILAGDTFTVAGETGTPTHTVTNGPYTIAAGSSATSVTFTPAAATGGMTAGSTLTFAANTISQITQWAMTATVDALDTTVMGNKWKTTVGGLAHWTGTGEALLDLGDANQLELVQKIQVATPILVSAGLVLRVATGKQWYGSALLTGAAITHQSAAIAKVAFTFAGDGANLPNWT